MPLKKSQRSLKKWTGQDWTTPSGKKSSETGGYMHPKHKLTDLNRLQKAEENLQQLIKRKEKLQEKVNNMQDMVCIKAKKDKKFLKEQ